MRKFIPIILGSDENAYACARMFYEISGERSVLLCSKALPQTSHSGILCRTVIKDFDTPSVFTSVMRRILPDLKKKAEKLLIVPCSDYYVGLVVKNGTLIRKYASNPIVSQSVYEMICDKIAIKKTCDKYGISHPQTEITLPCVALSQKKSRTYPLVLKPANSNFTEYLHSEEAGRKKAYICSDKEEFESALNRFVTTGYASCVVIQEYIGGGEEFSRVVNAYCDKDGRVRVIGAGIPLLEYKNDREIGNYAAIKTVKDRALCDLCADILEKIGYVGFANLDIKIDNRDGRVLLLEINPRQGRSSYYMRVAGVNFMQIMYEDAVLEKEYTGRAYAEGEGVWINEPVSVIRREMRRRGLKNEPMLVNGKTALDITYDFSIPRALTLIRRRLGAQIKEI